MKKQYNIKNIRKSIKEIINLRGMSRSKAIITASDNLYNYYLNTQKYNKITRRELRKVFNFLSGDALNHRTRRRIFRAIKKEFVEKGYVGKDDFKKVDWENSISVELWRVQARKSQYNWRKKNKKYLRDKRRIFLKIPKNKIALRLRARVSEALKYYTKRGKIKSSNEYGIDYKAIIEYLKPFPEDRSLYHIDHIRPLCSFNFINEDGSQNLEEIKKAFASTNHQWLLIFDNLSKGGKWEDKGNNQEQLKEDIETLNKGKKI